MYSQIERTDLTLNWINLAILGTIALIPLPTGVLTAAFDGTSLADQRTAVVLYVVIALFATAAWIPLLRRPQRHPDMLKEATPPDRSTDEVIRPAIGIAGYVVSAACGWLIHRLPA